MFESSNFHDLYSNLIFLVLFQKCVFTNLAKISRILRAAFFNLKLALSYKERDDLVLRPGVGPLSPILPGQFLVCPGWLTVEYFDCLVIRTVGTLDALGLKTLNIIKTKTMSKNILIILIDTDLILKHPI